MKYEIWTFSIPRRPNEAIPRTKSLFALTFPQILQNYYFSPEVAFFSQISLNSIYHPFVVTPQSHVKADNLNSIWHHPWPGYYFQKVRPIRSKFKHWNAIKNAAKTAIFFTSRSKVPISIAYYPKQTFIVSRHLAKYILSKLSRRHVVFSELEKKTKSMIQLLSNHTYRR